MVDINCYAYAEDELSCAVLRRLIAFQNQNTTTKNRLRLNDGFPDNKQGRENLKKLVPAVCNMAKAGIYTFILCDLDNVGCAPQVISDWFGSMSIPSGVIFRIAEHEIESWLLADREELASFLCISSDNFASNSDLISDPKRHLLNVIRLKGRRRFHRAMLPGKNARIGTEYNSTLCQFVNEQWNPERAAPNSPSLQRTLASLRRV